MAALPLRGIRIVDLSRLLPGPFATQFLCDLGAEVVKIEDHGAGGDGMRHFLPRAPSTVRGGREVLGDAAIFHAVNRGKRSVALSLREEKDVLALDRLLSRSDALVDSFRPGTLERVSFERDGKVWNLGHESLLERHPHLIACSIVGYSPDSEQANLAGHDLNYLAEGGVLGLQASLPGRGKVMSPLPVQYADIAGGAWPAAAQLLACLVDASREPGALSDSEIAPVSDSESAAGGVGRVRRGTRGRSIVVAMADHATASMLMPHASERVAAATARGAKNGESASVPATHRPGGMAKWDVLGGALPCYTVYHASCGTPVTVAALEVKFWQRLVHLLAKECDGDASLLGRLVSIVGGKDEHETESPQTIHGLLEKHCAPHPHEPTHPFCRRIVAACIASKSAEEWGPIMHKGDVMSGPIKSPDAAAEALASRAGATIDFGGDAGEVTILAPPIGIRGIRPRGVPGPALGSDTVDSILNRK